MKSKYTGTDGSDTITKYFKEVRKTELLTPEKEVELAIRIQNGDEKAMEEMVKANLKFVISVAKDYQGQGLTFGDLINEGNYGLIKAAQKFDHTKGFRFISYAVYWIKQSIMQGLNDNGRMIRLPVNVIGKLSTIKKQINRLEMENNGLPFSNEHMDDVDYYKDISKSACISLNNVINDEGDELVEFVGDEAVSELIEDLDNDKLTKAIETALNVLEPREREIIECYFGLNNEYAPMTLEDIGDKHNLTKERIRQIKEKAIKKLHANSIQLRKFIHN